MPAFPRAMTLLLIAAATLLMTAEAMAKKRFARQTGKECIFCHYNPQGGGARNLAGTYFAARGELPSPDQSDAEVRAAVEAWIKKVGETPPDIVWRYTPIHEFGDPALPAYEAAPDWAVLRRMALDLKGESPALEDARRLESGAASLDTLLDEYVESDEFERTFRLYHKDLIRPRTGIFNKPASLTRINKTKVGGRDVWISERARRERAGGNCARDKLVEVSPYWNRKKRIMVCAKSANEAFVVERNGQKIRCDTEGGQATGHCGCGPNLIFCYRKKDRAKVKKAMLQETSRLAMEVVNNDLPYSTVLTADWTMRNGRLDHFYSVLDGTLESLEVPDTNRKWQRREVHPRNSGILSTHSYLNFFYNGRRWAQRTFESFMCHETVPDYDFLDERGPAQPTSYKSHPLAEPDVNVNSGRACAACHVQLDGLSRLKDRWDNFGQYYPDREGVSIPQMALFQGQQIDGVDGLGRALGASDVFLDCVVNQAWQHMMGHRFTPDETRLRRSLLQGFKANGESFRWLIKAIAKSPAYRARSSVKLMKREQYWRTMEKITDYEWNYKGTKKKAKRGFDVFYDKVGGMDYRKIEGRDITPGQGHSLVQFKAAAETCDAAIGKDSGKKRSRRAMLTAIKSTKKLSKREEFDAQLNEWHARLFARPAAAITAEDREASWKLYRTVAEEFTPRDGYKAVCTMLFGSAEFAVY